MCITVEHAHKLKPTDSHSNLLSPKFIDGVTNRYIRSKLREQSLEKPLAELFSDALYRDEGQKVRAIDCPENNTIASCDINAVGNNACHKCGKIGHWARDCTEIKYNSHSHQHKSNHNPSVNTHQSEFAQALASLTDVLKQMQQAMPHTNTSSYHKDQNKQHNSHRSSNKPHSSRPHNHQSNRQNGPHYKSQRYQNKQSTRINEVDQDCTDYTDYSDLSGDEQMDTPEPENNGSSKN